MLRFRWRFRHRPRDREDGYRLLVHDRALAAPTRRERQLLHIWGLALGGGVETVHQDARPGAADVGFAPDPVLERDPEGGLAVVGRLTERIEDLRRGRFADDERAQQGLRWRRVEEDEDRVGFGSRITTTSTASDGGNENRHCEQILGHGPSDVSRAAG